MVLRIDKKKIITIAFNVMLFTGFRSKMSYIAEGYEELLSVETLRIPNAYSRSA